MDKLPLHGSLYAATGKMGVTLVFVSLGVLCLIAGAMYRAARTQSWATAEEQALATGVAAYFCTGQQSGSTTHSSGRIVLETWKYVTPPAGQPGTQ